MQKTTPSTSLRLLTLGGLAAGALAALPGPVLAQELAPPTAAASAPAATTVGLGAAAPARAFGAGGVWVLSVQSHAAGSSTASFSLQKVSGGNTTIAVQPALDYFIGNGISVGGAVGFVYSGSTSVAFGARAGFNQSLTDKFTFWPTAGVYGAYHSGNGSSFSTASVEVYAPFLYHPVEHFFLGVGPFLGDQFHGGAYTEYGLDFVIGGWL
jgi:hypothetical protein